MPYDIYDKKRNFLGTITEAPTTSATGVLAAVFGPVLLVVGVFVLALIILPIYNIVIAYKRLEIPTEWVYAQMGNAFLSSFQELLLPCVTFILFFIQSFCLRRCFRSKKTIFLILFLVITFIELWGFLCIGCEYIYGEWYYTFRQRLVSLGFETDSQMLEKRDSYCAKFILGFWIGLFYVVLGTGASIFQFIRFYRREKRKAH